MVDEESASAGGKSIDKEKSVVGSSVRSKIQRIRCQIPLAILLLLVTILVAAAIVIPVAVLSFQGADDTVNEILVVLRSNYLRQVQDKITSQLNVAYELAQLNAQSVGIRQVLDGVVDGQHLDFATQYEYQYRASVQRSSFLIAAGFARADEIDVILVGTTNQPGLLCGYSAGALDPITSQVVNQACSFFWIDAIYSNLTVQSRQTPFLGEPPVFFNSTDPYWDYHPYFLLSQTTNTWLGVLSFHWNQWRHLDLGESDSSVSAIGAQVVTISFEIFSTLLNTVQTTPNSAIAIWITEGGGLIATNKNQSVLDPGSISLQYATPYTPDTFPQIYIGGAAVALKTKYGDIFGVGGSNPTDFLPQRTSDIFRLASGDAYVETYALSDVHGFAMTIMLVIPEDDLLGPLKVTRKKVLGASLGIAIAMLAFAAATSAFVTRPVTRLTVVMGQATNMDFSAIQGGFLGNQSRIVELSKMQHVFGEGPVEMPTRKATS
ncbi:hypothetical protein HKX48_001356, partial [Thoreauomyces humboldtii]